MLLRGLLHSARPSTSHPRLSSARPLKALSSQALHSSTALPAKKKPLNLAPSPSPKEQLPALALSALITEHQALRTSHQRLLTTTNLDSDYPHLTSISIALHLPLPTSLPPLPPALDHEVFRLDGGPSSSTLAPHYQVLEWIGDRELNSVAAQVLVVLAPGGVRAKQLKWHNEGLMKLITGTAAARFATQLGMDRRFKPAISSSMLADRFESYVGALWACRGREAVLEFLAPIFAREMLKVAREDVEEQESRAEKKKESVKVAPALVSPKIPSKPKEDSFNTAAVHLHAEEAVARSIPLVYASINDAKSRFFEDLKIRGWDRCFARGKRSMTLDPPKHRRARVTFSSGGDGLTRLLRQAATVGIIQIHGISPVLKKKQRKAQQRAKVAVGALLPDSLNEKVRKDVDMRLAVESAAEVKLSAPKSKKPKLSVRGVIAEKEPSGQQKQKVSSTLFYGAPQRAHPLSSMQSSKKPSAKLSPPSSSPAPLINPSFFL
uniref:RNase III domain-containing protein n=1 Tax=Leucosporidium scottii TaxID=5278 RepID=A0A0H5FTY3_9BASI|nr:hypothetical protein [Leucosporidium scottii]